MAPLSSSEQDRALFLRREAANLLQSLFGVSVNVHTPGAEAEAGAGGRVEGGTGSSNRQRNRSQRQQQRESQRGAHGANGSNGPNGSGAAFGEFGGGEVAFRGSVGHALIDDDLLPSHRLSRSQPLAQNGEVTVAALNQAAAATTFSEAFPALPEASSTLTPIPWSVAATRAARSRPLATAPQAPASEQGPPNGSIPSPVLDRNMRLKAALGLGSEGEKEEAAAERMATVWPPNLRQWARTNLGDVVRLERRVQKELLDNPTGTSVSLKPMTRPVSMTFTSLFSAICM